MIRRLPAGLAIGGLKAAQVQLFHHFVDQKAQMILAQHIPHVRGQQIGLLRVIGFVVRHSFLCLTWAVIIKYHSRCDTVSEGPLSPGRGNRSTIRGNCSA